MDAKLLERLNKIKALADRGVGGERENAEALLSRLLEKYNVSEEELILDTPSEHEFRFWGHYGADLFNQVVYSIVPESQIMRYRYKKNCHTRFVKCTEAEAIQIKETFEFYRNHLDEGFKNYYTAFIMREEIFPENPPEDDNANHADISQDARRLIRMMDKHERRLMIESGEF